MVRRIRSYLSLKECQSVKDGLVTKHECIVIPRSKQNTVLQRIYDAYQGIEKCQLKAKKYLLEKNKQRYRNNFKVMWDMPQTHRRVTLQKHPQDYREYSQVSSHMRLKLYESQAKK